MPPSPRMNVQELEAALDGAIRECLADGIFPKVKEMQRRGVVADEARIARGIRARLERGDLEIPESAMKGLRMARGQWMRAGFRAGRRPNPDRKPVAPPRPRPEVVPNLPAEVIREQAAAIKADNLATGRLPNGRGFAAKAAMSLTELALSDYRRAWKRISGSTGREDRPGQEPRL